jgi:hypothetical protein
MSSLLWVQRWNVIVRSASDIPESSCRSHWILIWGFSGNTWKSNDTSILCWTYAPDLSRFVCVSRFPRVSGVSRNSCADVSISRGMFHRDVSTQGHRSSWNEIDSDSRFSTRRAWPVSLILAISTFDVLLIWQLRTPGRTLKVQRFASEGCHVSGGCHENSPLHRGRSRGSCGRMLGVALRSRDASAPSVRYSLHLCSRMTRVHACVRACTTTCAEAPVRAWCGKGPTEMESRSWATRDCSWRPVSEARPRADLCERNNGDKATIGRKARCNARMWASCCALRAIARVARGANKWETLNILFTLVDISRRLPVIAGDGSENGAARASSGFRGRFHLSFVEKQSWQPCLS